MASNYPGGGPGLPPTGGPGHPHGGGPIVPAGMIDRIRNILVTPVTEWPRIDAQPMTEAQIFRGWVGPLAAIGPIAMLIGSFITLSGLGLSGGFVVWLLLVAIVYFAVFVGSTWATGMIVDGLAPTFGATKDRVRAMKVVAFAATPAFLACVFFLYPPLWWLCLVGVAYMMYLLWIGLPMLMKPRQDQAVPYVIVSGLAAIVVVGIAGKVAELILEKLLFALL